MRELVTHMERAKAAYAAERYPGDLAREVLGEGGEEMGRGEGRVWGRRPRLVLAPLALTGVAATLVAAVMVTGPGRPGDGPTVVLVDPTPRADRVAAVEEEQEEGVEGWVMPGLPAFPEGMTLVPEVPTEGMPGLPSLAWNAETFAEGTGE